MNTIEVGRSTLSFAADATEVLESGIRNFGQNGAADYEELSNRLFLEGYAQHASTLTRVLNENGAPGTKYFEHIFAATAISARNISAANGEYSVFLSNKSYYPSNGSDFFVMPGRVKQFTAQGGDDVVMIGRGNSSVKDESGNDIYVALGTGNTIEFDASLDTITIARVKDTVTVTRSSGENDQLLGFAKLRFVDGMVAFDEVSAQAYRIYQAAFDRTPDLGGVGSWIRHLEGGSGDLVWVARHFIGSQEFQDTYGTPATVSNRDFITLLYANVLDRTPDDGGFAAWNTNMQNGMSREQVLVHFSESAENKENVAAAIFDGVWYY
jgi:hypothetical protein